MNRLDRDAVSHDLAVHDTNFRGGGSALGSTNRSHDKVSKRSLSQEESLCPPNPLLHTALPYLDDTIHAD